MLPDLLCMRRLFCRNRLRVLNQRKEHLEMINHLVPRLENYLKFEYDHRLDSPWRWFSILHKQINQYHVTRLLFV